MGFYGNISNITRSTFQFDRVYNNRSEMDSNADNDGVYVGRYVLIEYDQDLDMDVYTRIYPANDNTDDNVKFYSSPTIQTDGKDGTLLLGEAKLTVGKYYYTAKVQSYIEKQLDILSEGYNELVSAGAGSDDLDALQGLINSSEKTDEQKIQALQEKYKAMEALAENNIAAANRAMTEATNDAQQTDKTLETIETQDSIIDKNTTLKNAINEILQEAALYASNESNKNTSLFTNIEYYRCTSVGTRSEVDDNIIQEYATFEKITDIIITSTDNYARNYRLDLNAYKNSRGYDSTVWMKSYVGSNIKYVMIAELNTVVPTFDVSVDAPTDAPIQPHFDKNSTNVYYNLHLQPSWGFRVKEAQAQIIEDAEESAETAAEAESADGATGTETKKDKTALYSDVEIQQSEALYDAKTGAISTRIVPNLNGDIYFNKAGFNLYNSVHNDTMVDEISLTKASSGNKIYNSHESGNNDLIAAEDIQELSVHLPSIGNAVATLYDLLYGAERNTEISWGYHSYKNDGLRLSTFVENAAATEINNGAISGYSYSADSMKTLAACLNTVHDFIGTVIDDTSYASNNYIKSINGEDQKDLEAEQDFINRSDENTIYYDKDTKKYYRKAVSYVYTNEFVGGSNTTLNEAPLATQAIAALTVYEPDKYYTYADGIYTQSSDTNKFNENAKYCDIDNARTAVTFDNEYQPDTYYFRTETKGTDNDQTVIKYTLCRETSLSEPVYKITTKQENDEITYKVEKNSNLPYSLTYADDNDLPVLFFAPGYFWTKVTTDEMEKYNPITSYDEFSACKATDFIYLFSEYKVESSVLQDDKYGVTIGEALIPDTLDFRTIMEFTKADWLTKFHIIEKKDTSSELEDEYALYSRETTTDIKNYSFTKISDNAVNFSIERQKTSVDSIDQIYIKYNGSNISPIETDNGGYELNIPKYYLIKATEQLLYQPNMYYIEQENKNGQKTFQLSLKKYDDSSDNTYYVFIPEKVDWVHDNVNKCFVKFPTGSGPMYLPAAQQKDTSVTPAKLATSADAGYYSYTQDDADGKSLQYLVLADEWDLANKKTKSFYRILDPTYYIIEDTSNIYDLYTVWNKNADIVPEGVTIAQRKEQYVFEELTSFGEEYNTLLGLLLEIKQVLSTSLEAKKEIRDMNTVQGCINKLNDIFAYFDDRTPGRILINDAYDRVSDAEIVTAQKDEIVNYGTNEMVTKTEPIASRWLATAINCTPTFNTNTGEKDPYTITISHTIAKTESTKTVADKNNPKDDTAKDKEFCNDILDDTLRLYTPIVDAMGHIVGHNQETVTLPYGYKTIATIGNSAEKKDIYNDEKTQASSVTANNTQDTIYINPYNKWIQTTISDSAVQIAHEVHTTITTTVSDTDLTIYNKNDEKNIASFTIQDTEYDDAGHVIANQPHKIILPYGYLKISAAKSVITAESAYDTLNITGDHWLTPSVSQNGSITTVSFSHQDSYKGDIKGISTTITNNQTVEKFGDSFKVPIVTYDSKGHITGTGTFNVVIPEIASVNSTPSITNSAQNVLATISMNNMTGEITETRTNIGDLPLTGLTEAVSNLYATEKNVYNDDKYNVTWIASGIDDMKSTESLLTGLARIERRFNKISNEAALQYANIEGHTKTISAITTNVSKNTETINTITATISTITTSVSENTETINTITATISTITTSVSGNTETINTITATINTLQTTIETLTAKIEKLETALEKYHPTTTVTETTPTGT